MDAEEKLDQINGDGAIQKCRYCGRYLSVSHQSVCDSGLTGLPEEIMEADNYGLSPS